MIRSLRLAVFASALGLAAPVLAQSGPPAPPVLPSMSVFDGFNGAWRGTATVETPKGSMTLTQSERFGPMLGGAVRAVEGRGFGPKGDLQFNAFGVLYSQPDGSYVMHSWAQGRQGIYPVKPVAGGFDWEIPAGPMTIRYEARITNGKWIETGFRVMPGKPPVQFYRMELTRIGDTDWGKGAPGPR